MCSEMESDYGIPCQIRTITGSAFDQSVMSMLGTPTWHLQVSSNTFTVVSVISHLCWSLASMTLRHMDYEQRSTGSCDGVIHRSYGADRIFAFVWRVGLRQVV